MNSDSKYKVPWRTFNGTMNESPSKPFFVPRKLTSEQRLELSYRRYEGERVMDLALEYGVSTRTVYASSQPLPRP